MGSYRSRLVLMFLLLTVVACEAKPKPEPKPTPSTSESPSNVTEPPCKADQILILPRWGAAAGSYGGTWQFANISETTCAFRSPAHAVLRARTGAPLLRSEPWPEPTEPVVVVPGGIVEAIVLWGNWCSDEANVVMRIGLPDDGGSLTIVPPGTAPCSGPGQDSSDSSLSVEPFQATNKGVGLAPEIAVQQAPHAMAVGLGGVWVAGQERLVRFDTEGRPVRTFELGYIDGALIGGGSDVAIGEGHVWVTCSCGSEPDLRYGSTSGGLVRIDPETDRVTGTRIFTDRTPGPVLATEGAVWLGTGDSVTRIDAKDLRVDESIPLGGHVLDVVEGRKRLWVPVREGDTNYIVRISTATNRITARWRLPGEPSALVEHGALWVAIPASGVLLRMDVRTGEAETFEGFPSVRAIAASGGSFWVYDTESGAVRRFVDPGLDNVTMTFHVGSDQNGMLLGTGTVWLFSYRNGTVTRIAA